MAPDHPFPPAARVQGLQGVRTIGKRHDFEGLPLRRARKPSVATSLKWLGNRSYLRTGRTSSEVMPTAMTITEAPPETKWGLGQRRSPNHRGTATNTRRKCTSRAKSFAAADLFTRRLFSWGFRGGWRVAGPERGLTTSMRSHHGVAGSDRTPPGDRRRAPRPRQAAAQSAAVATRSRPARLAA